MNSKNIFKSIFVIIAIVLISTSIFASFDTEVNKTSNETGLKVDSVSVGNNKVNITFSDDLYNIKEEVYFTILFLPADCKIPQATIDNSVEQMTKKLSTIKTEKNTMKNTNTSPLKFPCGYVAVRTVDFSNSELIKNTTKSIVYNYEEDTTLKPWAEANLDRVIVYVTKYKLRTDGDQAIGTNILVGAKGIFSKPVCDDFAYPQLKFPGDQGNTRFQTYVNGLFRGYCIVADGYMFSGPNIEAGYMIKKITAENATPKEPVVPEKQLPAETDKNLTVQDRNISSTNLKLKPLIPFTNITYNGINARYVTESKTTISIIDNKTANKTISITLPDSFKTGSEVYAIFAAPTISEKTIAEIRNILTTGNFSTDYTLQQTGYTISDTDITSNIKRLKFTPTTKKYEFTVPASASTKATIVFMQVDGTNLNVAYTHLFVLTDSEQSTLYLCEINKKILNFYCDGYNCVIPNCIAGLMLSTTLPMDGDFYPLRMWEDGVSELEDLAGPEAVPPEDTGGEQPIKTVTGTELAKGSDGCYTSNSDSLTKLRAGAITLTKDKFTGGQRTLSSIVSPGTAEGTNDDPSITMAQISKIANMNTSSFAPDQKFKTASNAIYNLGLLYNVDPIYTLAIFRQEKSMYNTKSGNYNNGALTTSNNPAGLSSGTGCECGGEVMATAPDGLKYCKYPSLEAGFEAMYRQLNLNTYKGKKLSDVASIWNTGHTGNTNYSNLIKTHMDWIYANAN